MSKTILRALVMIPNDQTKEYGSLLAVARAEARKRLVATLQNPRLLRIHFHTFRHWKVTMGYHKTKDILHVMNLLGHKSIQNTLIYTQLLNLKTKNTIQQQPKPLKKQDSL